MTSAASKKSDKQAEIDAADAIAAYWESDLYNSKDTTATTLVLQDLQADLNKLFPLSTHAISNTSRIQSQSIQTPAPIVHPLPLLHPSPIPPWLAPSASMSSSSSSSSVAHSSSSAPSALQENYPLKLPVQKALYRFNCDLSGKMGIFDNALFDYEEYIANVYGHENESDIQPKLLRCYNVLGWAIGRALALLPGDQFDQDNSFVRIIQSDKYSAYLINIVVILDQRAAVMQGRTYRSGKTVAFDDSAMSQYVAKFYMKVALSFDASLLTGVARNITCDPLNIDRRKRYPKEIGYDFLQLVCDACYMNRNNATKPTGPLEGNLIECLSGKLRYSLKTTLAFLCDLATSKQWKYASTYGSEPLALITEFTTRDDTYSIHRLMVAHMTAIHNSGQSTIERSGEGRMTIMSMNGQHFDDMRAWFVKYFKE